MDSSRILVVEHELAYREALVSCLRMVGFETHAAESARAARAWLTTQQARLVVIASNLPDGSIEEVFGVAGPKDPSLAIVLPPPASLGPTRARPRVEAMFKRPVSLQRLVDHVEALMGGQLRGAAAPIVVGTLQFDPKTGVVSRGEVQVALGPTEARLLAFFMTNPDRVFARADLLRRLWPGTVRVEERTVDVHIGRLRGALATIECDTFVQTVRSSGYRFSQRT
jgi:two-component system, OmpR family, phosphate regulon response regulator PhoB